VFLPSIVILKPLETPKQDHPDQEQGEKHENDRKWRDYMAHGSPK
jgi:hypothetical protein